MSFPYSNNSFEQMFGGETAECVCQGLKDMFEYMGGVPTLLIFDNATGVGKRVKERVIETELFSKFRAHYGFKVRFCNPRSGREKGNVENKVGTSRRNLFVPVPHYHEIRAQFPFMKMTKSISSVVSFLNLQRYLDVLPDICLRERHGKVWTVFFCVLSKIKNPDVKAIALKQLEALAILE